MWDRHKTHRILQFCSYTWKHGHSVDPKESRPQKSYGTPNRICCVQPNSSISFFRTIPTWREGAVWGSTPFTLRRKKRQKNVQERRATKDNWTMIPFAIIANPVPQRISGVQHPHTRVSEVQILSRNALHTRVQIPKSRYHRATPTHTPRQCPTFRYCRETPIKTSLRSPDKTVLSCNSHIHQFTKSGYKTIFVKHPYTSFFEVHILLCNNLTHQFPKFR